MEFWWWKNYIELPFFDRLLCLQIWCRSISAKTAASQYPNEVQSSTSKKAKTWHSIFYSFVLSRDSAVNWSVNIRITIRGWFRLRRNGFETIWYSRSTLQHKKRYLKGLVSFIQINHYFIFLERCIPTKNGAVNEGYQCFCRKTWKTPRVKIWSVSVPSLLLITLSKNDQC